LKLPLRFYVNGVVTTRYVAMPDHVIVIPNLTMSILMNVPGVEAFLRKEMDVMAPL